MLVNVNSSFADFAASVFSLLSVSPIKQVYPDMVSLLPFSPSLVARCGAASYMYTITLGLREVNLAAA